VAFWLDRFGDWYKRSCLELMDEAEFAKIVDIEGDTEIEVRATAYSRGAGGGPLHLILHRQDFVDSAFVFVAAVGVESGHMHLVGWLPGMLGKHRFWYGDYFQNGRRCYAVPEDKLFPLSTLELHEAYLEKTAIIAADSLNDYDAALQAMHALNLQGVEQ
jgi:hypothetical protein